MRYETKNGAHGAPHVIVKSWYAGALAFQSMSVPLVALRDILRNVTRDKGLEIELECKDGDDAFELLIVPSTPFEDGAGSLLSLMMDAWIATDMRVYVSTAACDDPKPIQDSQDDHSHPLDGVIAGAGDNRREFEFGRAVVTIDLTKVSAWWRKALGDVFGSFVQPIDETISDAQVMDAVRAAVARLQLGDGATQQLSEVRGVLQSYLGKDTKDGSALFLAHKVVDGVKKLRDENDSMRASVTKSIHDIAEHFDEPKMKEYGLDETIGVVLDRLKDDAKEIGRTRDLLIRPLQRSSMKLSDIASGVVSEIECARKELLSIKNLCAPIAMAPPGSGTREIVSRAIARLRLARREFESKAKVDADLIVDLKSEIQDTRALLLRSMPDNMARQFVAKPLRAIATNVVDEYMKPTAQEPLAHIDASSKLAGAEAELERLDSILRAVQVALGLDAAPIDKAAIMTRIAWLMSALSTSSDDGSARLLGELWQIREIIQSELHMPPDEFDAKPTRELAKYLIDVRVRSTRDHNEELRKSVRHLSEQLVSIREAIPASLFGDDPGEKTTVDLVKELARLANAKA